MFKKKESGKTRVSFFSDFCVLSGKGSWPRHNKSATGANGLTDLMS